jgi:hypothetical protein
MLTFGRNLARAEMKEWEKRHNIRTGMKVNIDFE